MASSSRVLFGALLLAAPIAGAGCLIEPPRGPFGGDFQPGPVAATERMLPSNPGAWSTLIAPDPRHRWVSNAGLVESPDGSLLLRGVATGPGAGARNLRVAVFVDYVPATAAEITVWDTGRAERFDRVAGASVSVGAPGAGAAFDIALPPLTVPEGSYREIQTLVWLDGGEFDARRWTVYAGPNPPGPVPCIAADAAMKEMPGRSRLEPDGRLAIRAPRAATLAVLPIFDSGPAPARFVRIDEARRGWEVLFDPAVEIAAVWEDPFAGPGPRWISSLWSAGAD